MIPAYAGFALALYPSLRRASAGLTAGFLGFRLMACGFHLLAAAMLPLLLDLSQGHGTATPDAATYELLAETLRKARDLVNHVAVIVALGLGDLLLFTLLHRWRLVPRWLSLWGLCGAGLAILASLLVLSQAVEIVAAPYLLLNAPLALQSLVLGAWLIGRGLREPNPAPRSREAGH
jgi:ascorbate-specific PTS system EIIC-type component UlaA